MGHKQQTRVVEAFRRGELNLLIATSVAEEGLDIQPCNLVPPPCPALLWALHVLPTHRQQQQQPSDD
jgi:hypothetical protein